MFKLQTGDTVIVRAGNHKGKTGKITSVDIKNNRVTVEGINLAKKHQKPTQANPAGGLVEITRPIHVSNVGIVNPKDKNKASRIGYKIDAKGKKARVYRQAGDKEIK